VLCSFAEVQVIVYMYLPLFSGGVVFDYDSIKRSSSLDNSIPRSKFINYKLRKRFDNYYVSLCAYNYNDYSRHIAGGNPPGNLAA